jgi:hypothetical protein
MNCKKCGTFLTAGSKFCPGCGSVVETMGQPAQPTYQQPAQPTYQQPMYQQPMQPQPKKGGNLILYFFGILILLMGLGLIQVMFDKEGESPTDTAEVATYKVNYKGFTMKLPQDIEYNTDNGVLSLYSEENGWATQILIQEGSYSDLLNNKGAIKAAFQRGGYAIDNVAEKTFDNKSFITYEVVQSGEKFVGAYTQANVTNVFVIVLQNENGEFDYEPFEALSTILKSATYDGSQSITIGNIDINAIADLIISE